MTLKPWQDLACYDMAVRLSDPVGSYPPIRNPLTLSVASRTVRLMARDWETWLGNASGPASATEEADRDRTESRIREAIRAHPSIPGSVRIYAKGSYANGTNVRRDADVDIAVEWNETQKVDTWGKTKGLSAAELGYTPVSDPMTRGEFRSLVEDALTSAFGSVAVDRSQDKHVGLAAGTNTLEADVVPCFALARYDAPRLYFEGHRIYPRSGGYVDNFPKQNYENGVRKNASTLRRYKQNVRCLKRLFQELYDDGVVTQDYPGYLTECLLYNVPNPRFFGTSRLETFRSLLAWLWTELRNENDQPYMEWTEPSELIMLFRGHRDRVPANAFRLVDAAWDAVGVG